MCNLINKAFSVLLLLAMVTVSCDSGKKKDIIGNDNIYTVDFDNTLKEEKIYMSSLFKKVKPIPLETTDESLIGYIRNVQIFDGKIFVLDKDFAKGVFVFDMDGKFIRKIGRIGQGPGEYVYLSDFTIDEINRQIYLIDRDVNCIIIYDIDTGKYIKQIKIFENKYSNYIQYYNGRLYTDANDKSELEDNYLLHEVDLRTGKYKNSWLSDDYNKGWMHLMFFNNFFNSRNHPQAPKYAQFFMDTVFVIKEEGISPFLTVQSSKWVSEKDIKMADDDFTQITDIVYQYNKIYGINTLIEGKDIILFRLYEGNKQWHVLYDSRNGGKNVRIVEYLINDILFEDERFDIWRLCCSDEKGVYSILPIEHLSFTENLDEKIKKDVPNRDALLNAKEDDNPIILYFEYE
jgi:hypothetical protein